MKTKSTLFAVLDYVYENPGCSTTQIATALGINYSIVKRILDNEYAMLRLAKSPGSDTSTNTDTWKWYTLGM